MSRLVLGLTGAAVVAVGAAALVGYRLQNAAKPKNDDAAADTVAETATTIQAEANDAAAATDSITDLVVRGERASASGKVLVIGGYLVLEPAYAGLVLGLSARFHSHIYNLATSNAARAQLGMGAVDLAARSVPLVVYAPQRSATALHYSLSWSATGDEWTLTRVDANQEANKFVEFSVIYSLLFLVRASSLESVVSGLSGGLFVYLEGDHQFYSAAAPDRLAGSDVPPVVPDGSKTGLGSSAALVSSLVAVMMAHFGGGSSAVDERAHRLAQFVHCAAQGKVGSGFDVSAAFHGSHVYQRFHPRVIQPMIEATSAGVSAEATRTSVSGEVLSTQIAADAEWTNSAQAFSLPPGLSILLGDVAGGASTPVMVKKVLAWRANAAASERTWTSLANANAKVVTLLAQLNTLARDTPDAYEATRRALALLPAHQWSLQDQSPVGQAFSALASAGYAVRHFLRELGTSTDVDVEPPEQGRLLDQTIMQAGVALAGVPGAGGDDAIFAVVLDSNVEPAVEQAWNEYRFPDQDERRVRRLPLREAETLIQVEQSEKDISAWTLKA